MMIHDEKPTPSQALDELFNAAVGSVGGVRAANLFNIVRAEMDRQAGENVRLRSVASAAREFTEWDWLHEMNDGRTKDTVEADLHRLCQRIEEWEKEREA